MQEIILENENTYEQGLEVMMLMNFITLKHYFNTAKDIVIENKNTESDKDSVQTENDSNTVNSIRKNICNIFKDINETTNTNVGYSLTLTVG